MPRNAQGQYFLPDGNPVTPGELIKSEWANSTMGDIASALSNSLERTGAGGMLGQFKAATGTVARPGISFVEDNTSGIMKETTGVVALIADSVKQAYYTRNGFFLVSNPSDKMEAATKAYVDALEAQATHIMGTFGKSKTPAQLPQNGAIPANWDAPGVPSYALQMEEGQSLVYRPTDPLDPNYDNVFVFVGSTFTPTSWVNIGKVQGPVGPQGETGPQGPIGPEGPIGKTGPTGQTGGIGPAGPTGPQGPLGPQGPQGPAGQAAELVGDFGVSKTPADLPVNGFIPKGWDSPNNPAKDIQMVPGESLVYSLCPDTADNYGHVYSYVGTGLSSTGWIDCGDIVGPAGPQGPQGKDGPQGPQGPAGKDGAQGAQGPTGSQGPKGDTGAQGDPGKPGSDATVTKSSVTTALGYLPPSPTGDGASGTWNIGISGNAASATNAQTAASCSGNAATSSACTGNAATASVTGQVANGNWAINFDNDRVQFVYKGTLMAILDGAGNLTCKGNVTGYGAI